MSRAWHLVLALGVAAALALQLWLLLSGGPDANAFHGTAPVDVATRLLRFFSYFTVQSNLLVLLTAAGLALDPARDGRLWRVLRADALLGIAVTGVVFATVLRGLVDLHGAAAWANAGFHCFAPLWTLLGWWCFGPRPRADRRTLAWAFAWPVLWLGWTLVHGAWTGWYPYPFLDAGALGYPRALAGIGVVLLLAAAGACVLGLLDRRLAAAPPHASRPYPTV